MVKNGPVVVNATNVILDWKDWRQILYKERKSLQSRTKLSCTKKQLSLKEIKPDVAAEVPCGWKVIEQTENSRMMHKILKKGKKKGAKATVADFGAKVEDSTFLNALQNLDLEFQQEEVKPEVIALGGAIDANAIEEGGVKFEDVSDTNTKPLYQTDRMLLREAMLDNQLSRY